MVADAASPHAPYRRDQIRRSAPADGPMARCRSSRKVPEVVTPIVGQTGIRTTLDEAIGYPAPQPRRHPGRPTWYQQLAKMAQGNDFSGAAKALAGAFKKPPAPPVYRMSGIERRWRGRQGSVRARPGRSWRHPQGSESRRAGRRRAGQEAKKARQDDPHEYEQERFDWRRQEGDADGPPRRLRSAAAGQAEGHAACRLGRLRSDRAPWA